LAVIGVIVCTFVVGLALWPISSVGILACVILGAIIATTDPVAVVGIFHDIGAPRRLSTLVQGESLFNDAAAIAIYSLAVAVLAVSAGGRRRLSPSNWESLVVTWEQLAFWASSLIFLFAAMQTPELLEKASWADLGLLVALVAAALAARAMTLYGLIPML